MNCSSSSLSLLMVSHLFFSSPRRAGPPPRIPLFAAIVSGVVIQLFLWLRASFTLAGFHCSRRLASRPGNQQVHRQVRPAQDKAHWLTAAAPRSFTIGSLNSCALGKTWQRLFHTDKKKLSVLIFVVVIVVFPPLIY